MKLANGIWFPDDEKHLVEMISSSPLINNRGTYQYYKLAAALSRVKQRKCALDVGMHVGLWAMHLAKEFETVIGFEPVAEHIDCLIRNMEGVKNYEVYNCALGREKKEVGLKFMAGSTGSTQIDEAGIGTSMMALDDLEFSQVDFIKIDVENYEPFVVEGGEATIKTHKPVIILEQKAKKAGSKFVYGREKYEARDILLSWGAKQFFEMNGDFCLGWN